MKVIDLLNKIANGETPQKIRIDRWLYTHNGIDYTNESGEYLFNTFLETTTKDMNMEVEIIEEDKKIEKIKIEYSPDIEEKIFYEDGDKPNHCILGDAGTELLINKINELIDKVNSLENKQ